MGAGEITDLLQIVTCWPTDWARPTQCLLAEACLLCTLCCLVFQVLQPRTAPKCQFIWFYGGFAIAKSKGLLHKVLQCKTLLLGLLVASFVNWQQNGDRSTASDQRHIRQVSSDIFFSSLLLILNSTLGHGLAHFSHICILDTALTAHWAMIFCEILSQVFTEQFTIWSE